MTIAIIIFLLFLLLGASIIFAHVHFALWRSRGEKLHMRVHSWFFALDETGKRILFFHLTEKTSASSSKKTSQENLIEKSSSDDKKNGTTTLSFGEIWANRDLFVKILSCALRFLRDLLQSFPADEKNEVHIYASAAEPDELGLLCSIVYPLIYANSIAHTFTFEPDFVNDQYDADIYGNFAVHTSIARIMFIILLLLYRLPKIRIYKFYRQLQKKKKMHPRNHGSKPSAR